jgi:8-oxo-dGTP pyrophosphatase MutT (NUDIX family)
MRQLAIEEQASCSDYRVMSTHWISKLGRRLARTFSWEVPAGCVDYFDRDAERMAREVELIRMRFPHHS